MCIAVVQCTFAATQLSVQRQISILGMCRAYPIHIKAWQRDAMSYLLSNGNAVFLYPSIMWIDRLVGYATFLISGKTSNEWCKIGFGHGKRCLFLMVLGPITFPFPLERMEGEVIGSTSCRCASCVFTYQ